MPPNDQDKINESVHLMGSANIYLGTIDEDSLTSLAGTNLYPDVSGASIKSGI